MLISRNVLLAKDIEMYPPSSSAQGASCTPYKIERPYDPRPLRDEDRKLVMGTMLPAYPKASHWLQFPVHLDPLPRVRWDVLNDAVVERPGNVVKGTCALDPRPIAHFCPRSRAPLRRGTSPPPSVEQQPDDYLHRDIDNESHLRKGVNPSHAVSIPVSEEVLNPYFVQQVEWTPGQVFRQWTTGKSAEPW